MGRPKLHNSPRAYISSRKDQVKRFRKLLPNEKSDYERIEKAIQALELIHN